MDSININFCPGNSYGVLTPSVEYLWPMAAKEESQDIDLQKLYHPFHGQHLCPLGPPMNYNFN